jgi:hypothetical protein
MKFFAMIAMLCTAMAMSAAETALLSDASTVKSPSKGAVVAVKDGVITIEGKSGTDKYNYLFTRVTVDPVVVQGKKISITIEPTDMFKGDTVYFKGLDVLGKEVFSYVAYALPAKKATYVIELGKTTSPFRWLEAQIKTAPETPVAFLQFFYGRATKESDMKVTISDIKLVD